MKHQKVEQRNECIDYFKKCPVWKRVFTGFRDKYLSYGRFAGKIVIKKLSAEEIEELWQTAGLKKYSHWRSLRGILECLCMQRWK